jgi:hypothetical protein
MAPEMYEEQYDEEVDGYFNILKFKLNLFLKSMLLECVY